MSRCRQPHVLLSCPAVASKEDTPTHTAALLAFPSISGTRSVVTDGKTLAFADAGGDPAEAVALAQA